MSKLLVKHNFLAIVFSIGTIISLGLSVYKPSRKSIFLFLGFVILLFSFEYEKHIAESLRDQTLTSLITIRRYYKLEWFINVVLIKILPILFPLIGCFFLFTSVFLFLRKKKKIE